LFADELFCGAPADLTPLSIVGEFATDLHVEHPVLGDVRVLYPWRAYDQLEVSMTEYFRLFDTVARRVDSGRAEGARQTNVFVGKLQVRVPVIVPRPHCHAPNYLTRYESELIQQCFCPWALTQQISSTVGGRIVIHLDSDQYNAMAGL
jgi:propanediol utilization protein